MHYGLAQSKVAQLRKERSLIVDPGRRTFDWLVTQGMQQIDKRSHSVPRGMHDVLHTLIEGISRSTGSHYRDYEAVDAALRTGKKPVVFQKEYDLARHLPLAKKIPDQAVAEMMHYVGDASDIRNIILVGGGAFFYRAALKTAFPNHVIHELKDPIFANVKGFQQAGMELARTLVGGGTDAYVRASHGNAEGGSDDKGSKRVNRLRTLAHAGLMTQASSAMSLNSTGPRPPYDYPDPVYAEASLELFGPSADKGEAVQPSG
eukprot:gene34153-42112_t